MSDPQLRKDIADLSLKLAQAKARIAELESAPPKVVERVVEKEVHGPIQYVYRDVEKEVPVVQIKRVEVPVVKEVKVPQPVIKEVIKYVKCPKQEALIKELRAKLRGG